jgi:glutamate carboxypeptidase
MSTTTAAGASGDATRTLHEWMLKHEDELVAFLQKLVDIDSATELREGVETVAQLMVGTMKDIGFAVTRKETAPPPEQWIYDAFMADRGSAGIAPAVECRLGGGNGRGRILMMGHIDTAFPVGAPSWNPFRIDHAKKRAYGPAVADMKGGDAGIVFACRALVETGVARPEEICVIFDTDEQGGSVRSRPLIEAEARRSNWGLVTEAGRVGGEVVGQRAGIAIGEIVIEGVEAHLGTGFRTGRSAIEAMCRKVIALHKLHDPDRGVLLNVGEFNGGTRRNLYAGKCVARLDIRCVDHDAWNRTKAAIEAIAAADDLPGTTTTLKLWQHRPPMPWTPETTKMAALVSESAEAMGTKIDTIPTMGASDANIIASQGVPTLCGLGPVGGAIMTKDEYIELPTLAERATLVAALAHKLSRT